MNNNTKKNLNPLKIFRKNNKTYKNYSNCESIDTKKVILATSMGTENMVFEN